MSKQSYYKYINYINIFILLIAIVIRTHNSYFFNVEWSDKLIQYTHIQSVLKGYGIGLMIADTNDVSKIIFQADGRFAPAYPLCIAIISQLTQNLYYADVVLDLIAFCLFFISWYYILKQISICLHPLMISATFIIWAFSVTPFRFYIVTDFHALAIYSAAIALLMRQIIHFDTFKHRELIINSLFLGIICFLCSLFRFSYYALTFALPLFYVLLGVLSSRKFLKYGLISFITAFVCVVGLLAYQNSISLLNFNEARYTTQMGKGFQLYFDNLLRFANIPWYSFFPDLFWQIKMYLEQRITFPQDWFDKEIYAKVFFILLYITLLVFPSYQIIKTEYLKFRKTFFKNPLLLFYLIGIVTILINFSFLTALSLYYPLEMESSNRFWNEPKSAWTFVEEVRYFTPSILFFQIFFIIIVFYRYRSYATYLRILVLTICMAWGSYMWVIWYYPFKWDVYSFDDYRKNVNAIRLFLYEDLPMLLKDKKLVVTSENKTYLNLSASAGMSVFFPSDFFKQIKNQKILTSEPIKLVIIEDSSKKAYKNDTKEMLEAVSFLKTRYAYQEFTTYYERMPMAKTDIKIYVFDVLP